MKTTGRQDTTDLFDPAIEVMASEWLVRRDAGLDAAAKRALADWLAADPRHREVFASLDATGAVFDRVREKGVADTVIARLELRAIRRRRRIGLVAAASLVVVALFLQRAAFRPAPVVPSEIQSVFEPIRKLPDGSIVELNTGSEIAVQYAAATRRVRLLRGEAHFTVMKDASRPFLVEVSGLAVRAVGTAFTVQQQAAAVEVVVTEGRVALDKLAGSSGAEPPLPFPVSNQGHSPAAGPQTLALVDAGNRIVVGTVTDTDAFKVSPMTENQIDERLAWRVFEVKFGGIELAEAIALMNRANQLQIVFSDASIGRLRISGVFHVHNPEGFIHIIEATFDLKSEPRGENEISLRRNP